MPPSHSPDSYYSGALFHPCFHRIHLKAVKKTLEEVSCWQRKVAVLCWPAPSFGVGYLHQPLLVNISSCARRSQADSADQPLNFFSEKERKKSGFLVSFLGCLKKAFPGAGTSRAAHKAFSQPARGVAGSLHGMTQLTKPAEGYTCQGCGGESFWHFRKLHCLIRGQ